MAKKKYQEYFIIIIKMEKYVSCEYTDENNEYNKYLNTK